MISDLSRFLDSVVGLSDRFQHIKEMYVMIVIMKIASEQVYVATNQSIHPSINRALN